MLRIRAYGTFDISLDEESITAKLSSTQMALLLYLAWTGCPQQRSHLAELFWPDRPAERSLSNLRTVLSQLRGKLGHHLNSSRASVWLEVEDEVWFDAAIVGAALAALHVGSDDRSLTPAQFSEMESAVSLCNGAILEAFPHIDSLAWEEWLYEARRTLEAQVITAFTRLGDHYFERKHFSRSAHFLRRLIQLSPYAEGAYAQLMTSLALTGQPGHALNVYDRYCAMLQRDFGELGPGDDLMALAQQIRRGDMRAPLPNHITTAPEIRPREQRRVPALPQMLKPLLGREEQLQTLLDHARSGHRLISVVGMGGVGKTHLLTAALRHLRHFFRDGVYYVDLSGVNAQGVTLSAEEAQHQLVSSMAAALGIHFHGEDVEAEQMLHYLSEQQACLVFDNFESVIQAASFVTQILGQSTVTVVTGTRMRLKLSNEILLPLEGLSIPGADQRIDLNTHSAVALFADAARRTSPNFQLAPTNTNAVVRIAEQVGGLPLALELAAAWIEHFEPAEISQRIEESLAFLATDAADVPERQRRFEKILTQSAALLTKDEMQLLTSLSIFAGPFSRSAALTVSGADLSTLVELVNKQWLHTTEVGHYCLHPLIKQYTQEQLARQNTAQTRKAVARNHAQFVVGYVTPLLNTKETGQRGEALNQVRNAHSDLRLALKWLLKDDTGAALDLVCDLARYWEHFGLLSEAADWLDQCLTAYSEIDARLTRGLSLAVQWVRRQPTLTQLEPWIEKSFDLLDQLDSPLELADLCRRLGWHAFNLHPHPWQERGKRAVIYLEQTISLYRLLGRNDEAVAALLDQAIIQMWTSQPARAEDILHEAEMRSATKQPPLRRAQFYHVRAMTAYFRRQYDVAWSFAELAAAWAKKGQLNEYTMAWYHKLCADIAWHSARFDDAWRHAQSASTIFRRLAQAFPLADLTLRLAMTALQRGDLTTAAGYFVECIEISHATGFFGNIGAGFIGAGLILCRSGQADTGARLVGYGAQRFSEDAGALLPWDEESIDVLLSRARLEISTAHAEALFEEGKWISAGYAFDLVSLPTQARHRTGQHAIESVIESVIGEQAAPRRKRNASARDIHVRRRR
ncbi:MAG: BTAD domain-containing putative transcriptional regulator [Caldilineaceae bacterium]